MSKTVLITGASSGIGKASTKYFVEQGWNVAATMRKPEQAQELAALPTVLVSRLDVQDEGSIQSAIDAAIARFGKIDVLVNNAGYGQYGPFEAVPEQKVHEQFDVNVFGPMRTIRCILPHFRANGEGTIINISSGAGIFTLPMMSMYAASKFALEGFSESLSYELGSQNIAVRIVQPHGGVTNTDFNARSAASNAADPTLSSYNEYAAKIGAAFKKMSDARSISSEDVAKVVFEAATDTSDRLRYLVGNDTRGFIAARYEKSEEDYIRFMRSRFE